MTFKIVTDTSELVASIGELVSFIESSDRLPEHFLAMVKDLKARFREEVTVSQAVAAAGSRELVVRFGIVPGGRFEACIAAARALRSEGV